MDAKNFINTEVVVSFCDMVQQELSAEIRVVLEEDNFVAFTPYASRFPFEIWILPKIHSSHFENLQKIEIEELAQVLRIVLLKLEASLNSHRTIILSIQHRSFLGRLNIIIGI